ncbi:hypothetical protein TanjilG_01531 [Lupinus angustifolius]|nr:hypothetical protein TanjilG_01531 [Lupinus angustifolius]
MDRLISLDPSNIVPIRIEQGQKCYGRVTLCNVMYTMPVAFRLQPLNKAHYNVKPQSGIISPLATITLEIIYYFSSGSILPHSFPHSQDSFLLHSVIVPGALIKGPCSMFDAVPSDWFTTKKKQVFIDSGIRIIFVGSQILEKLIVHGSVDDIREVLERSDPLWKCVDSKNRNGERLLHLAVSQGRPDLVQLLLEFKPDLEGAKVDSLTKDGNTALHLAVEEHRRDCARILLSNGARIDIRNAGEGDTPLHIAASTGDDNMVNLLLQKGANKDVRNRQGKTAYDFAAENGHFSLFDALCLGDKLCIAARKGEVRTILKILESGAAINGRDQNGWTALHRASFKGRIDSVRILLEKGIDFDAKDEEGYTALHCASESGHADVTDLLVKKGADVEARTSKGVTAFQIAESLHYVGITRILVQNG